MRNLDIIVMGKTGAGKSTLVNTVLEENVAPVGSGQAITKENHMYKKKVQIDGCSYNLRMYDTVGLEIDESITNSTLSKIKSHIVMTKRQTEVSDLQVSWFCINYRSNRLESYEIDLIRKMSIEYEIPFVIVITKAIETEEGELLTTISKILPELPQIKILAQDYPVRTGVIKAFGIKELLQLSTTDYTALKGDILKKKLCLLDVQRNQRINELKSKGMKLIEKHVTSAKKIGFVPAGCIPFVHGICIKMIGEIDELVGIKMGKEFANEVFGDVILGIIATPLMMVPLLSVASSAAYVKRVGEDYLQVAIRVVDLSTDKELKDIHILKQRIKTEMQRMQKGR